ncbi:MAG TPA: FAD binding domain-containing protein [Burkholderiales bacterium]|nr:FAD binding domain-containing protein [Burkholderiales bacterium]
MITLPAFTLMRPATLAEAARLAAEPDARLVAGGTGLLPNLRLGLGKPRTLVSLDRLAELQGVEISQDGIRIGAGVTLDRISRQKDLPTALHEAARSVAAPGHRSAATVGGNLCLDTRCVYYNQSEHWRRSNDYCLKYGGDTCHVAPQGRKCRAAYSGDLAPALLALEAQVETTSRSTPLENLYRDDGASHLALSPGEIVVAVRIPAPKGRSGYAKARGRGAIDYPLAGVAMVLDMKNGQITGLRVALTGTNSRPFVLAGTDSLASAKVEDAGPLLMKLVQKQAGPVRTTVSAADYRRQAAAILARRLLGRLSQGELS